MVDTKNDKVVRAVNKFFSTYSVMTVGDWRQILLREEVLG